MSIPSEVERQARSLVDDLASAVRPLLDVARACASQLSDVPDEVREAAVLRGLIGNQLYAMCGGLDDDLSAEASAQNDLATERVDTILAFIELAKGHNLPRKLLPHGDPSPFEVAFQSSGEGSRFEPGDRITVLGTPGVVAQQLDHIRVKMDGMITPIEVPRITVSRVTEAQ